MHLTVIAKQPQAGLVKTRLCPPCTLDEAASIAGAALADTLDAVDAVVERVAGRCRVEPGLLFEGDPTGWIRPGYRLTAQRGHGLAERLANGFDELGPGVIVGMEAAEAIPSLVAAFEALAAGTDVLGLAVDGGYWVIGLHTPERAVFESVPMSTSATGITQLRRLHALGRGVRLLPMAHDLDTVDDLRVAVREGTRVAAAAAGVLARSGGGGPAATGR